MGSGIHVMSKLGMVIVHRSSPVRIQNCSLIRPGYRVSFRVPPCHVSYSIPLYQASTSRQGMHLMHVATFVRLLSVEERAFMFSR